MSRKPKKKATRAARVSARPGRSARRRASRSGGVLRQGDTPQRPTPSRGTPITSNADLQDYIAGKLGVEDYD